MEQAFVIRQSISVRCISFDDTVLNRIMKNNLINKFYKKSIVYDKFLFLGIEKHLDSIKQDIFVDVHKKSFDIKFENPTSIGIILRTRFDEVLYSLYTKVCSFPYPATITIVDEMIIKKFVDVIVDQVMNYSITEIGGKNFPLNGIFDDKANAWTYCICSIY